MSERQASPFWKFSLRFYKIDGVAPACLTLQDRHGIDVNVMLFGLWLAHEGRTLERADMHYIMDAAESWRTQVVVPLRSVRRILREPADAAGKGAAAFDQEGALALREKIKVAELEAERLQQEALFALKPVTEWGAVGEPFAAAAQNLELYARSLRAEFDPAASRVMLDGFAKLGSSASA